MDMFLYLLWGETPPTPLSYLSLIIEYTFHIMSCLRWCLVWYRKSEQKGFMESTSSFGSFSFYEYASPTKVVLWLASIFSGIIFCLIVSKLRFFISSVLCEIYEWSFCLFPLQFLKHMFSFIWKGLIPRMTSCNQELFVGNFKAWLFCSFLKAYTSTAILSSLLIKKYGKLSSAEKIEWNNRWSVFA